MGTSKFLTRITAFCADQNITKNELAQKLKLEPAIFENISAGNQDQAILLISRIAAAFNISLDELLYKGFKMYYPEEDSSLIPVVNVRAYASYLENFEDAEYIRHLDYFRIPGFEKGNYRIFEIDGDSMSPTVENGDYVICRKNEEDIKGNQLYVVVSKKGIVIKRVFEVKTSVSGSIVLRSDNEQFKDMILPLGDIQELWTVEGKITRSFMSETRDQAEQIQRLENDLKEVQVNINRLIKLKGGEDKS